MAVTSFIRTIESDTPYDSFFVVAFGYFIISSLTLGVIKYRKKEEFRMSWHLVKPVGRVRPNEDNIIDDHY